MDEKKWVLGRRQLPPVARERNVGASYGPRYVCRGYEPDNYRWAAGSSQASYGPRYACGGYEADNYVPPSRASYGPRYACGGYEPDNYVPPSRASYGPRYVCRGYEPDNYSCIAESSQIYYRPWTPRGNARTKPAYKQGLMIRCSVPDEFRSHMDGQRPVVVYLFSASLGQQTLRLENCASALAEQDTDVTFLLVNVDDPTMKRVAQEYGLKKPVTLPTFIFCKNPSSKTSNHKEITAETPSSEPSNGKETSTEAMKNKEKEKSAETMLKYEVKEISTEKALLNEVIKFV